MFDTLYTIIILNNLIIQNSKHISQNLTKKIKIKYKSIII